MSRPHSVIVCEGTTPISVVVIPADHVAFARRTGNVSFALIRLGENKCVNISANTISIDERPKRENVIGRANFNVFRKISSGLSLIRESVVLIVASILRDAQNALNSIIERDVVFLAVRRLRR